MNRPTVTAEHIEQRRDDRTLHTLHPRITPGVELRVEFTLGDEAEALAALDRAIEDVREQISAVDFAREDQ